MASYGKFKDFEIRKVQIIFGNVIVIVGILAMSILVDLVLQLILVDV